MPGRLIDWFKPPVFENNDEKTRRALVLNALQINLTLALLIGGGAGILFFFSEKLISTIVVIVGTIITLVNLYLTQKGHLKFVGAFTLVALWFFTTYVVFISNGTRSLDIIFYVAGTVVAGILFGSRGASVYVILSLATSLAFAIMAESGFTFPQRFPFPPFAGFILLTISLGFTIIPLNITLKSLSEALTAARRYADDAKERADQLEILNEIGRGVSSLQSLESALEIVYQQIRRILPVDAFYICLYDRQSKLASFPIMYDMGVRYNEPTTFLLPDTWITKVVLSGEPFMLHRTEEELGTPNYRSVGNEDKKSASILIVPLLRGELVTGALSVQSYSLNAYTEKHIEILTGIGMQVAIAIENSQLYSALQEELAERRKVETAREVLIQELQTKNDELERFNYTVSHDLKTPLVTIKGFLGYLEADAESGNLDRLRKDTKRIANAVDKMNNLLSDLLELSRIGRIVNPPEEIPFGEIVREAIELVQGIIEAHQVMVEVQPDLPTVSVDKPRMVEALQNLIDNAVKFMGEQQKPKIEIGAHQEDGKNVFFVKDNGIGIDTKYQSKVFDLFERLEATTAGTGIGLALVKRIIEAHGGRIWVDSRPGEGSTFFFTLEHPPAAQ